MSSRELDAYSPNLNYFCMGMTKKALDIGIVTSALKFLSKDGTMIENVKGPALLVAFLYILHGNTVPVSLSPQ